MAAYRSFDEVLEDALQDPQTRAEWDRTQLARDVSIWLLRSAVALSAAPILLHNSSYLTELAGPGTREWTPAQTWVILGSMAAVLLTVWVLLALLVRPAWPHPSLAPTPENTAAGNTVPLAVAIASRLVTRIWWPSSFTPHGAPPPCAAVANAPDLVPSV